MQLPGHDGRWSWVGKVMTLTVRQRTDFGRCVLVTARTDIERSMVDAGQIKAKREAAELLRRLALHFTSDANRRRALAFALDIEAEAHALELATQRSPQVTQVQVQVQPGPPTTDRREKKKP